MPKLPIFDQIEYLVSRRHPIANARAAGSINVDKPDAPSNEINIRRAQALDNFRKVLSSKTPTQIAELAKAEKKKAQAEIEEHRFYNRPSARADFDHYCKAAYWTLDECVALSFGKNPKQVNWKTVQPCIWTSPFAQAYEKLRDLTSRAKGAGQLFDPVGPSIYLAWAKEHEIALCDELINCAVNSGISLKSWRGLYNEQRAQSAALRKKHNKEVEELKETLRKARSEIEALREQQPARQVNLQASDSDKLLGTKERESLLKLVGGMAVRGYGFDPTRSRNEATGEIRDDLEALGLGMNDDTVRKYLKQGVELISREALENIRCKPNSGKR